LSRGTPVARLIVVRPRVEFKAIEGDALDADPDFRQCGSDLAIEAIAVHPEVGGGVAEAQEAGNHGGRAQMRIRPTS
jgi:hypothetical protein